MIRQLLSGAVAASLLLVLPAFPQAFSSGSSGSDGALNYAANLGTIVFDPLALGLDADGDNIYHFTTITVLDGTTLQIRADKMRNPSAALVWLATGNVRIAGIIDVRGQIGNALNTDASLATFLSLRTPPVPGPGGYPGGLGARGGIGPEPGAGPGGGPGGAVGGGFATMGGSAAHQTAGGNSGGNPRSTATYGNFQLIPLFGGSGGGGGWGSTANSVGGIGGAGGGAIRIISTTSIDLTPISGQSVIDARGGSGGFISGTGAGTSGGSGSGGSIHLIAPSIPHFGSLLDVRGTATFLFGSNTPGGDGYIRISTNTINPLGTALPSAIFGPLFAPPLPTATPLPAVRIVSVNNVNAPSNPQGNYLFPDVQINSGTAVNVAIAASNIPLGTIVRLRLASEVSDSIIDCAGLAGSIASSTAICSATFPFSVSIANLRASW